MEQTIHNTGYLVYDKKLCKFRVVAAVNSFQTEVVALIRYPYRAPVHDRAYVISAIAEEPHHYIHRYVIAKNICAAVEVYTNIADLERRPKLIAQITDISKVIELGCEAVNPGAIELIEKLNKPIIDLNLSVRAFNALMNSKLDTPKKILEMPEREIRKLRNFGTGKTIMEIKKVMMLSYGMSLNPKDTHREITEENILSFVKESYPADPSAKPLYSNDSSPKSKMGKNFGIEVRNGVYETTVVITPGVGVTLLGEDPAIMTDILCEVDKVLAHWGK